MSMVEDDKKVLITAECGINWAGDFGILSEMVSSARDAGADIVKLQAFREEHVAGHPLAKELLKASVSKENVQEIDSMCKSLEMPWYATPFFVEALDFLDPYVDRYKIRERDSRVIQGESTSDADSRLLQRVIATGKPVYISVVEKPLTSLFWRHHPQVQYLYVLPQYPAKIEDVEFWKVKAYQGYSNHVPGIEAPFIAAVLGARFIEVHVSLMPKEDYVDGNVSLSFPELKTLVKMVRTLEKANVKRPWE